MKIFIILFLFYSTIWGLNPIAKNAKYDASPAKRCINNFRSTFNQIVNGEIREYDMSSRLRYLKDDLKCIKKDDAKFESEFKAKLDLVITDNENRKALRKTLLIDKNCVTFGFYQWRTKTKYTTKDINGLDSWLSSCSFKKFKLDIAKVKKDSILSKDRGSMSQVKEIEKALGQLNEMVTNQNKAVHLILENYKTDLKKLPLITLDKIKTAVTLATLTTSILNNDNAKKTLTDAKKALADVVNFFSKYHTSTFHKDNVGKSFLSDTPILVKKEQPSLFKKVFTPNDKMFIIGYEITRILDYLGPVDAFITVKLKKDGKRILFYEKFVPHKDKVLKQAYLTLQLLPGNTPAKKVKNIELAYELIKALNKLGKGKHKLQLSIGVYAKNTPRSPKFGEVEFEFDNDGKVDLGKLEESYAKEALNRVRMPHRGKRNKRLEKKMLRAIKTNKDWKEKPLRAVITGSSFDLNKNRYTGAVLGRHIWGAVAVKRKDGTCSIFRIRFYQSKNGRRWANPTIGMVAGNKDIKCKNIWK